MVTSIHKIMGKVNPHLYAENGKELLKKYGNPDNIPVDEVNPKSISEHNLIYDSSSEQLEPIYFFIIDLMNDMGLSPEKLIDNFTSSPGSGHFSELGQRKTIMQQQGQKLLGDVNSVLRSILNIIYDLKELRSRLDVYNDLENKDKKESALISLKQIWMDKVDMAKGNTSIKAMAFQGGFQTLIDAFMVVKTEEDVKKLDLNERARRILMPRLEEFNAWLKESERELRKRYELEKNYLRSQVNSLKLYSKWIKPYLKAASDLESEDRGTEPALVKTFNTIVLDLTILGKSKAKIEDAILEGTVPPDLKKLKLKRDYYACVLIDFNFRGIPQRAGGQQPHYVFGGKTNIKFSAYALNSEEIEKFNREVEKSDIEDVMKLIQGATDESLDKMYEEINFFLEEKSEKTETEKKKQSDGSNPFSALIGLYNKTPEEKEKHHHLSSKERIKLLLGFGPKIEKAKPKNKGPVKPDDWLEKTYLRPLAISNAEGTAFDLFDIYKKAHGMPNYG